MNLRRWSAAALVVAALPLAAACGGDDTKSVETNGSASGSTTNDTSPSSYVGLTTKAATAKAEQYAAATGQSLGEVLSLREVSSDAGGSRDLAELSSMRSAAFDRVALPIRAGKDDLGVKVAVVWAFSE